MSDNVDIVYRETKLRLSSKTIKSEQTNFEDPLIQITV